MERQGTSESRPTTLRPIIGAWAGVLLLFGTIFPAHKWPGFLAVVPFGWLVSLLAMIVPQGRHEPTGFGYLIVSAVFLIGPGAAVALSAWAVREHASGAIQRHWKASVILTTLVVYLVAMSWNVYWWIRSFDDWT